MRKPVFGLIVLLVLGFLLVGCNNETPNIEDGGFGVWLVTDGDYTAYVNAGSRGQPKPTAIAHIPSLGNTFTAAFKNPINFNPDTSNETTGGWWNIGDTPTQWTAVPGDYFVFIIPYKIYPDNVEWIWSEGKISASGSISTKININANSFTLSLADFKNTNDVYSRCSVWLVTDGDYTAYVNAGSRGQPKPTAIAHIPSLGNTFTAAFKNPINLNPDTSNETTGGWWNIGNDPTQWTAVPADYVVLIVPMYFSSGIPGQGNLSWMFDKGKISASGSISTKINIDANPFTFSLAGFKDISEL